MFTTTEYGSKDAASTCHDGTVAINRVVQLLRLGTVVIERALADGFQIDCLRLLHACHVGQHEVVGMQFVECCDILGYHRLVHLLVEFPDLALIVHRVSFFNTLSAGSH